MKNKMIIDSFNKINCDKKDIIFERIFFKKKINYRYVVGFATCLLFILAIGYRPEDKMSPLNVRTDNIEDIKECNEDDLECIMEFEREKE